MNDDPIGDTVEMLLREDLADEAGALKPMSIRMEISQLAWVDAMAAYAGKSRQAMARQLIRAGIAAVLARLPDPVQNDIGADAADRLQTLQEEQ